MWVREPTYGRQVRQVVLPNLYPSLNEDTQTDIGHMVDKQPPLLPPLRLEGLGY